MKRKLTAWLCALAVLISVTVWPARAEEKVFFTAVNENVLPLVEGAMPFWSDGYLYVAATTFTGSVRTTLNVAYVRTSKNLPILYGGGDGRSLQFDLTGSIVLDEEGRNYYPAAIEQNGVVFVPIALVCYFFGMSYSRLKTPHGWMVRIKNASAGLSDDVFVNAATYSMELRYQDYLRSQEPQQPEPDDPEPPSTTDTPAAETPEESEQPAEEKTEGKPVYLCLAADDGTAVKGLLGELERAGVQAAFYCTEAFLMEQGDLLRQMCATGQTIGLLVDGSTAQRTAAEQMESGNAYLYQATCGKTRLVYIQNPSGGDVRTAQAKGYLCLTGTLDRSKYPLKSAAEADNLLKRVSARRGTVKVWLGDSVDAVGLRTFLAAAEQAGDACLPVTETAP